MRPPAGHRLRAPDAARRAADVMRLHQVALSSDELMAGRYVALRLSDGGSDNIVYETRAAAITHQLHETMCLYMRIPLTPISDAELDTLLWYARRKYDSGHRESPDSQLMIPSTIEELKR